MIKKNSLVFLLLFLSQPLIADVTLTTPIDEKQENNLSKTFKVEGYQDQEYTYGTVTQNNDNKITGYVYLKKTEINEVIIQEEKIPKLKSNSTGEVILDGKNYYLIPKKRGKKIKTSISSELETVAIYGTIKDNQITAYDFNGNLYQLKIKP